jgi:hypothetical protein
MKLWATAANWRPDGWEAVFPRWLITQLPTWGCLLAGSSILHGSYSSACLSPLKTWWPIPLQSKWPRKQGEVATPLLIWPWRTHCIISALSDWWYTSALFVMGGDWTRLWTPGIEDYWVTNLADYHRPCLLNKERNCVLILLHSMMLAYGEMISKHLSVEQMCEWKVEIPRSSQTRCNFAFPHFTTFLAISKEEGLHFQFLSFFFPLGL